MTRDDIGRIAVDAGIDSASPCNEIWMTYGDLVEFAMLVAHAEREECAKLCESTYTNGDGAEGWLEIVAGKIRARTNSTVKQSLTVDHRASSGASVEQQLTTERDSLFAESQRKQQLERQRDELLTSLGAASNYIDHLGGLSNGYRAVIQKVRGGE